MPFIFTPCSAGGTVIDGLFEVQPKVFGDNRGYFFEVYSEKENQFYIPEGFAHGRWCGNR
jgi:dTDP-4-dehydrorhamnose 3,5-epimerase-like enzyme